MPKPHELFKHILQAEDAAAAKRRRRITTDEFEIVKEEMTGDLFRAFEEKPTWKKCDLVAELGIDVKYVEVLMKECCTKVGGNSWVIKSEFLVLK